jgi:hypothetical protein
MELVNGDSGGNKVPSVAEQESTSPALLLTVAWTWAILFSGLSFPIYKVKDIDQTVFRDTSTTKSQADSRSLLQFWVDLSS